MYKTNKGSPEVIPKLASPAGVCRGVVFPHGEGRGKMPKWEAIPKQDFPNWISQ